MAYIGRGEEGITRTSYNYIATAGQTSFSAKYTVNYVDVYWNGIRLDSSEYTANNTTSVVLATPSVAGDKIDILCWDAFSIVNNLNVTKDSATGAASLPSGTTVQRPAGSNGMIRYNSTIGAYEGFSETAWTSLGGAVGGASDRVFYENDKTVTSNYTITTGKNAGTFGPVTVADGVTVTIPDNSTWSVV